MQAHDPLDSHIQAPLALAPRRVRVLGVTVDALTADEAVAHCREAAAQPGTLMIGVVNAAKIVKMRSDELLRDSVLSSDLVLADGMSVVWASRLLGSSLPERVTGIDLFERLLGVAEEDGRSVYFLGARPECLDDVLERVRRDHPKLRIAGHHHGYFGDDDEAAIADDIARSKADFLFVGITSPKKEIFLNRWGTRIDASLCHGVGGSFDVYAGWTRRAPVAWQRMGIEWLYRVLQEPRRMWRRYLVTNTVFVGLVARQWLVRAFTGDAPSHT